MEYVFFFVSILIVLLFIYLKDFGLSRKSTLLLFFTAVSITIFVIFSNMTFPLWVTIVVTIGLILLSYILIQSKVVEKNKEYPQLPLEQAATEEAELPAEGQREQVELKVDKTEDEKSIESSFPQIEKKLEDELEDEAWLASRVASSEDKHHQKSSEPAQNNLEGRLEYILAEEEEGKSKESKNENEENKDRGVHIEDYEISEVEVDSMSQDRRDDV
ncbi:hypothetical protein [Halobacillus seohaensis]|uniref:Uncharacterized protein n=1 Tax=Halobacillus seohaensis TaxID=447421 RepID=A0ABW2EH39_9BACI